MSSMPSTASILRTPGTPSPANPGRSSSRRPLRLMHLAAWACPLASALLLPACASTRPANPQQTAAAQAMGELRPPQGDLTFQEVYPALSVAGTNQPPAPARFRVIAGQHTGKVLTVRHERIPPATPEQEGERWDVSRFVSASDVSAGAPADAASAPAAPGALIERRQHVLLAGPTLMLHQIENHDRSVRIEFKPDALSMPASLAPAAAAPSTHAIRIVDLKNPRKLRERGTGDSQLVYENDQTITVPAGTFETRITRETYTSTLQHAVATRVIVRWYAPAPVGLVRERWTEEVKALGLIVERSEHEMELIEAP